MIPLSLQRIATVTGGHLVPAQAADVEVHAAVVTDSREVEPGSLYIARVGEHADGHDYLEAAVAAGAVAAVTNREVPGVPCVVVADTELAFARIGREVVDRCTAAGGLKIVGITGSSGKTSTKDLMAQVISTLGPTIAPIASYNSEIGVPLTVCRLTEQTEYLIAEMGASGIGHIEYLTKVAPPQIGVVLNVGTAHLGEFGGRDAIATAKSELVKALPAGSDLGGNAGLAVLNADDPVVAAMAQVTPARVVRVGVIDADHRNKDLDVYAEAVRLDGRGRASFTLVIPGADPVEVSLRLHGPHHVHNALAVAAVAAEWGMSAPDIATSLAQAEPQSRWRMEVHELPGDVTLVNDAYNANPDSMRAAILALGAMRAGGRTIAVVGEMRELGEESETEHRGIGVLAAQQGVDVLIAVGAGAAAVAEGYGHRAGQVYRTSDADSAESLLRDVLGPGDVVLLKSSRDSGLRYLGDRLVDDPPAPRDVRGEPAEETSWS